MRTQNHTHTSGLAHKDAKLHSPDEKDVGRPLTDDDYDVDCGWVVNLNFTSILDNIFRTNSGACGLLCDLGVGFSLSFYVCVCCENVHAK